MQRFSIAMADGDISLCSWMAGAAPTGDKPVLHWAHANGFNGETYTPLLEPLQARFDICAWDSRGHGLTSLPANPEEMTGWHIYRDDLIGVIEHLAQAAGQKIWLGGHSMGGCASIMAAAQRPDLVAGLVLTDPVIVPSTGLNLMRLWYRLRPHSGTILMQMAGKRRAVWPDIETITAAYTGRGAFATWQDGFLDAYLRGGLLPHEDDAGNRLKLACAPAWEAANFKGPQDPSVPPIKKLQVPFTLLMAETGSTTRAADAFHVPKQRKKIAIVPGSTHFLPMEFPELVREDICRLIEAKPT